MLDLDNHRRANFALLRFAASAAQRRALIVRQEEIIDENGISNYQR
jgi:hypothetical protein